MSTTTIALVLVVVWMGALFDVRLRRVPNWLTVGGISAGLVLHSAIAGVSGLGTAMAGFAVGIALLLPGFLARATGPGDVKLLAAAGALLGPYWALVGGLMSIVAGACLAAGVAAADLVSARAGRPWQRYGLMLKTLAVTGRFSYVRPLPGEAMGKTFPFAVAIAAGVTAAVIWASPSLLGAGSSTGVGL